jgi:hypothetical protein
MVKEYLKNNPIQPKPVGRPKLPPLSPEDLEFVRAWVKRRTARNVSNMLRINATALSQVCKGERGLGPKALWMLNQIRDAREGNETTPLPVDPAIVEFVAECGGPKMAAKKTPPTPPVRQKPAEAPAPAPMSAAEEAAWQAEFDRDPMAGLW